MGKPRQGNHETAAFHANQGLEAFASGDLAEAERLLRDAIALDPGQAKYFSNLGTVLHRCGRLAEARDVLQSAVSIDADHAIANDNLGVVLTALGQPDLAIDHHQRAASLQPDNARIHSNLGLCLEGLSRQQEAEASYREALRLDPTMVAAWCGLGRVLGDDPAAEEAFNEALAREPDRLTALLGLSSFLRDSGRHTEALRTARRACRAWPDDVAAKLELAQTLSAAARDQEALRTYHALKKSGLAGPPLWFSLAACYANLGRAALSDNWFRKALAQAPGNREMRSAYLFMLAATCHRSRPATLRELRKWEEYPGEVVTRFNHKVRGRQRRKLRIGYLSPDFRQHVVRQFFEPVLWHHDGEQVEVFCYSEARQPDAATWALRWGADRWFRTHGLSDRQVAQQIFDDKVDVLVDLAGHTAHNRLGVMAWKPAPVQATYLGYFGSSGVSAVDYWISDDVLHPADTDEPAVEELYRLPRCAYAYGIPSDAPMIARRDRSAPVTFGCFNNASKAGLDVVDCWAEILHRCPGSRLLLKDRRFQYSAARQVWKKRFQRRGIDPSRICLSANSPHHEYMDTYNSIDIALDPFPRTGGTTTCDALWMGVPVITLAGNRYVTRLSATKLSAAGVEELITYSHGEYIDKAVTLAHEPRTRQRYHDTLRDRMAKGQLGDPAALARELEIAYREMFDRFVQENKQL